MARFGAAHPAKTLIVAGVKFMGESAKILSQKTVLMPTLEANCSLDLGCPAKEFSDFCDAHPERTVVVYANTAAVKARADWIVTSSIALEIVDHLDANGENYLGSNRHLGHYIQKQTGADMLMAGRLYCHDEFKANGIRELKRQNQKLLCWCIQNRLLRLLRWLMWLAQPASFLKPRSKCLIKTLLWPPTKHFLQNAASIADKNFIEAPTGGEGATCRSCAHCPWMNMNSLAGIEQVLLEAQGSSNEIFVDEAHQEGAKRLDVC